MRGQSGGYNWGAFYIDRRLVVWGGRLIGLEHLGLLGYGNSGYPTIARDKVFHSRRYDNESIFNLQKQTRLFFQSAQWYWPSWSHQKRCPNLLGSFCFKIPIILFIQQQESETICLCQSVKSSGEWTTIDLGHGSMAGCIVSEIFVNILSTCQTLPTPPKTIRDIRRIILLIDMYWILEIPSIR